MSIPKLKRVRVTSEAGLRHWLAQNAEGGQSVMLVTRAVAGQAGYVSRAQVAQALADHGWSAGPRYTLTPHLLGHVIVR